MNSIACATVGGVPHLLVRRVLAAVADVGGDGAGEQHRLLRDEADPRAQVGLRHLAHVDAVHQHAAVVDVVEARNQPGERRLARAGAADDRGHLAGMRRERHAGERRLLGARILEGDVLEFDVAALRRARRLQPAPPDRRSPAPRPAPR